MTVTRISALAVLMTALVTSTHAQSNIVNSIWSEDFQGLTGDLQPAIDAPNGEGPSGQNSISDPDKLGWTHTAPDGWMRDASGVPTINNPDAGVAEWEGWSFATIDFWSDADDQRRSEFQADTDQTTNIVAIADPDEWDDFGSPADTIGFYNSNLFSATVDISGATDPLYLEFDSSWRDECCDDGPNFDNNQTAVVLAAYDGIPEEVLRWESDSSSPFFKDDAPDEFISIELTPPAGTQSVALAFQLQNGGNDWWWAVDNVNVGTVPEPGSFGLAVLALLSILRLRQKN